jgi:hypothetical protein
MADKQPAKFIGLSIDELLEHSVADLRQMDEMKVDKEIRDSYDKLVKSLHNQRTRMSSYFFVYSKFIVLKLEF